MDLVNRFIFRGYCFGVVHILHEKKLHLHLRDTQFIEFNSGYSNGKNNLEQLQSRIIYCSQKLNDIFFCRKKYIDKTFHMKCCNLEVICRKNDWIFQIT